HVEVDPAAIEQETAVAGRFLVIPIVQVDRADPHPAEEVILDSHRPGVAVRVDGAAAHQAAIFGLDPCDAIHPERASDSVARWTRDNAKRKFPGMSAKPFPARSPAEK